jgi:hypothetical protein
MWCLVLSSCVPASVAIPSNVSQCVDEAWTLRGGGVALLGIWWLAAIALAGYGRSLFRRREAELGDDRSARRMLGVGVAIGVVGVPVMLLLVLLGVGANCGL